MHHIHVMCSRGARRVFGQDKVRGEPLHLILQLFHFIRRNFIFFFKNLSLTFPFKKHAWFVYRKVTHLMFFMMGKVVQTYSYIHIIYALTVLSVKCTQETACGHPASSPPNRAWPASHTCLSSGPLRVYREGAGEAGSRGCQSCLARGVSITRARIIQSHPGLGSFLSRWNHFKVVSASEAKIKHILW